MKPVIYVLSSYPNVNVLCDFLLEMCTCFLLSRRWDLPRDHPTNKIEAWRQRVTTLHIKPNENFYHLCKIFHQQQDEIPWHKNMCSCLRCYYRFDRSLKAAEAQSRDPVSQQHSNVQGKSMEVSKKALDVSQ